MLERKPDIAAGKYSFVVPNASRGRLGKGPAPKVFVGSNPVALPTRRALGERPLWLGERFDGHRLQAVTIGSTFDPPTGVSPKAARFVSYDYGNVVISEFNARDLFGSRGGPLPGRMTLEKPDTVTNPNSLTITGLERLELSRDGVFVSSTPSQGGNYVLNRARALGIARALRSVPLP